MAIPRTLKVQSQVFMMYDEEQTPPHVPGLLRITEAGRQARRFWNGAWKLQVSCSSSTTASDFGQLGFSFCAEASWLWSALVCQSCNARWFYTTIFELQLSATLILRSSNIWNDCHSWKIIVIQYRTTFETQRVWTSGQALVFQCLVVGRCKTP